ncbi:3-oxoacyl-[acyl-carrier protein] reductase [Ekhidna lutea]|uniref:3-oxoacyl-[acyl-carrier protein] reductase n=1 Tax=Ekhidna lutea TaxID=447679 RepID=A0A239IM92_EKHLU|nr:SDR family oxidoreductase [Ekhidna lutea]SNS94790.1 3-oxoacyl-[acyl-carrier protein] reductase [Ekhidna lutea]
MDLDLKGRRALVCGSSQGMGFAIAKELSQMGARVTLFARNEASLKKALSELAPGDHDYLVADFDDLQAVENAVDAGLAKASYQILINNSGGPAPGPLSEASLSDFETAMNRHLHVSHTLVQKLLGGMKEAGYGRIINIISTSVKVPIPGLGVSNTVRGAMASWSKTLANELGQYGITVNNILPGFINTARIDSLIAGKSQKLGKSEEEVEKGMKSTIPAGRFGEPEEIAAYAGLLCSKSGAYINGTSLRIDGGRTGSI